MRKTANKLSFAVETNNNNNNNNNKVCLLRSLE